jgi:hypothetical protein
MTEHNAHLFRAAPCHFKKERFQVIQKFCGDILPISRIHESFVLSYNHFTNFPSNRQNEILNINNKHFLLFSLLIDFYFVDEDHSVFVSNRDNQKVYH